MNNTDLAKLFKRTSVLMELHDENPFKTRMYGNAAQLFENLKPEVNNLSTNEMESIEGLGKSIARDILEINDRGSFELLDLLVSRTPPGILELISIKGIGPKKVKMLWKTLGVETVETLLDSCQKNEVAKLKGFGEKSQKLIARSLKFKKASRGKVLFWEAAERAKILLQSLSEKFPRSVFKAAGALRRKTEVISEIVFICGTSERKKITLFIDKLKELKKDPLQSGPFTWRGNFITADLSFALFFTKPDKLYNKLLQHTGSEQHLREAIHENTSLGMLATGNPLNCEEDAYAAIKMQYVLPELREGLFEIKLAKENNLPKLVCNEDLKGALHNHSLYSDGKNTIREMSQKCMDMGLEYLGMSDHSKSAFYAGGLDEYNLVKQWKEIDLLNEDSAPFRIFKGIESDILGNGSLDYEVETLKKFDFIVASIHSNMNMTRQKATERLLRAIENPYTTILGHPSGRLLLAREGYPIDHKTVIKACASRGVIMEINANPWRLDLDWRWVHYALDQGVLISINPDAHNLAGLDDMYYGVAVGRKGGLTADKTFNAWPLDKVAEYFNQKKTG